MSERDDDENVEPEPECPKCGGTCVDPMNGENCPECGFGRIK